MTETPITSPIRLSISRGDMAEKFDRAIGLIDVLIMATGAEDMVERGAGIPMSNTLLVLEGIVKDIQGVLAAEGLA